MTDRWHFRLLFAFTGLALGFLGGTWLQLRAERRGYVRGQADAALHAEATFRALVDSASVGHGMWTEGSDGRRVHFYSVPVSPVCEERLP